MLKIRASGRFVSSHAAASAGIERSIAAAWLAGAARAGGDPHAQHRDDDEQRGVDAPPHRRRGRPRPSLDERACRLAEPRPGDERCEMHGRERRTDRSEEEDEANRVQGQDAEADGPQEVCRPHPAPGEPDRDRGHHDGGDRHLALEAGEVGRRPLDEEVAMRIDARGAERVEVDLESVRVDDEGRGGGQERARERRDRPGGEGRGPATDPSVHRLADHDRSPEEEEHDPAGVQVDPQRRDRHEEERDGRARAAQVPPQHADRRGGHEQVDGLDPDADDRPGRDEARAQPEDAAQPAGRG